jgi:hypothetical protein
VHCLARYPRRRLFCAVFGSGGAWKQHKLIAEIARLTKRIVCSEVHVDVRFRLVDHFFLKLPEADISKKIKILEKFVRMNLTAAWSWTSAV